MVLVVCLLVVAALIVAVRISMACPVRAWVASRGLRSDHLSFRHMAMRDLAKCGEPGLRRLCDALDDVSLQGDIIDLMILKPAVATPLLIERLSVERADLREGVAKALRRIGKSAIEDLVRAYTHAADTIQRQAAGRLLSELGGRRATKAFLEQLEQTDPAVRREALEFLHSMDERAIMKVLVDRLNHGHDTVRSSAARTLGTIGYSAAIEPLMSALQDANEGVRAQAAMALAQLKAGQAVLPITELLAGKGHARNYAIMALGDLRDKRAVPALRGVLEEEKKRAREIENRIQSQFGTKRNAARSAMMFELSSEQREINSNIQMIEHALHKLNC